MDILNLILLVILAAELFLILSNLSKLREELNQRKEKPASEPSEVKSSQQK
jgi:large-conductance mechanosensitive channel